MKTIIVVSLLLSLSFYSSGQNTDAGCSIWRRDVKILSDLQPDALNALLGSEPDATATVTTMRAEIPPQVLTNNAKFKNVTRFPSEKKLVRVKVTIVAYKMEEEDKDYHLVIADPNDTTQTIVGEIPSPLCSDVAADANLQRRFAALRAWINTNIKNPTSKMVRLPNPIDVEIIGVPFWDGVHPRPVEGEAHNFHEIHPIVNIVQAGTFVVSE